jgi:hypothetical protein
MYSEPFLVRLSSNPSYLFLFFLLLLVLFHLVFVKLIPLSDKTWKRVAYLWFGAAALGLIGTSSQAGRFVGSNYLKNLDAHAVLISVYVDLQNDLKWGVDGGVCTTFQASKSSDKYIDEVVSEHNRLCEDYKALLAKLPQALPDDAPSLDEMGFVMPQGQDRLVGAQLRHLKWLATRYEEIRSAYSRWKSNMEIGAFEAALVVLGPLLIAFALALRITKITGDIVNANKDAANKSIQESCRTREKDGNGLKITSGIADSSFGDAQHEKCKDTEGAESHLVTKE